VKALLLFSALLLTACSTHGREEASKCEVTEAQLRQAIQKVSRMSPYTGKRAGRCDLIVDDGRAVSVITPDVQKRVEEMIAREKAESKN
jgi:outer membrane biogenesis lipoprotein LolB